MANYIRMIIVLSAITLVSGLALGALNEMTYEKAADNVLKFKKIPAVTTIFEAISGPLTAENRVALETELLAEKKNIDLGTGETLLAFVIRKDNAPYAVAIEKFGQGFGGDLGVMSGFKIESGELVGIGITTLAETPGVGSRVTEPVFVAQFSQLSPKAVLKVKKDGGNIDAIAGATISSRAVATAVADAKAFYETHREKIVQAISQ